MPQTIIAKGGTQTTISLCQTHPSGGRGSLAKTVELIIDFCRNCDNKSVFPGVLASFFVFLPQKFLKEKDI